MCLGTRVRFASESVQNDGMLTYTCLHIPVRDLFAVGLEIISDFTSQMGGVLQQGVERWGGGLTGRDLDASLFSAGYVGVEGRLLRTMCGKCVCGLPRFP